MDSIPKYYNWTSYLREYKSLLRKILVISCMYFETLHKEIAEEDYYSDYEENDDFSILDLSKTPTKRSLIYQKVPSLTRFDNTFISWY